MQDYSHMTEDQVKMLLRAVSDDRDRLCLLMCYLHGLRISEAVGGVSETRNAQGLVIRHVVNPPMKVQDTTGGYLKIARRKGSKDGVHMLLSSADPLMNEIDLLEKVIRDNRLKPTDALFQHARDYYQKLMKEVGVPVGIPAHLLKPHALRHSIAMVLVKKIDLYELARYLGHRSLNSTGQYLRVTDAEASAAVGAALK